MGFSNVFENIFYIVCQFIGYIEQGCICIWLKDIKNDYGYAKIELIELT